MRIIIDRFEDDFAVVETENGSIDIPRSELPTDAKAGDILKMSADGYTVLKSETSERRKRLLEMTKRLTKE